MCVEAILASEAIQGPALALEGVDHVEGSDGLATAVLGVGHSVTDDVLQEDLEDTCRNQKISIEQAPSAAGTRKSQASAPAYHESPRRSGPRYA